MARRVMLLVPAALATVVGACGHWGDGEGTGVAGGVGGTATGGTGGVGGAVATGGSAAAAASSPGGTGGAAAGGTGGAPAGAASVGGTENAAPCTFTVDQSLSGQIPTVGIVTWSVNLPNLTQARIEFGLTETGPTMIAPVDLAEPSYRTLLLGMKSQRGYVFRIIANSGDNVCQSQDYTLTTGALLGNPPNVQHQLMLPGSESRGFIITSVGTGSSAQMGPVPAYIFDTDGDVVWSAPAPANTSRARMSYDGKDMWMMALNVQNMGGGVRRVSMDGLDVEDIPELSNGHHDFAVLPGGIIAAIVWSGDCSAIVERMPDGQIVQVVPDVSTLYVPLANDCHTNAINYYPDDTYTLGDRNPDLFVKISRQGQLIWQFGGNNPLGPHIMGTWNVNHGHHMLPDGRFVFFNNGSPMAGTSMVLEYQLDETNLTATPVWDYTSPGNNSSTLGDVQRLPNGNTLVTFSAAGVIQEVDPERNVVQQFGMTSFGYADFRVSLYGAPLR